VLNPGRNPKLPVPAGFRDAVEGEVAPRKEATMERDDRDMQEGNDAPTTDAPADGPAREPGQEMDEGATSQDQPGGGS
jgi:hypothetical protein